MSSNPNKLKVAIIYHYFAHYREPVLRELMVTLGNEFEFILISDRKADIPSLKTIDPVLAEVATDKGGLNWHFVRNRWIGKWLWQQGLLKKILEIDCQAYIFLGQINFVSTWFAAVFALLRQRKIFFWTHGIYGNEGPAKLEIRLLFYRLAHGILLYGNYSRNQLLCHGFSPHNLYVIFNSLNYLEQKMYRDSRSLQNIIALRKELFPKQSGLPLALFIGRLTAIKQLDMVLHAVNSLKISGSPVNCLFVGNGPQLDSLRDLAFNLDIQDEVCFYGECYDEKTLSDLIFMADVCVSPGNVGLTAMHSLVYGTPVVTHDDFKSQMPEFEAILPEVTGSFFKKGDLNSLIGEMYKWLIVNREIREDTRLECYKIIDKYYNPIKQAEIIRIALKGVSATMLDFGPQKGISIQKPFR